MSVPDVTPICIPSDDDDSDVEIVREEKINLDDGDVIFVSQTSAPAKQETDKVTVVNPGNSNVQNDLLLEDAKIDTKPQSVISCHRSLSISSGLEMALNLHDTGEVGAPLDLSARKSEDESEDSDSSCGSTSFSSSDESSLLDISDQVEIKTENNLPCTKLNDHDDHLNNSDILTLHTDDNFLPHNLSYIQDDVKPTFSLCKFESLDKLDCSNQQGMNSSTIPNSFVNSGSHVLSPDFNTTSVPVFALSGPPTSSPGPHTSSKVHHMPPKDQGPHTSSQGPHTLPLKPQISPVSLSSSSDDPMQCSAPKKRKENSPESDIWATIRKDLDFLNDSLDAATTASGASVPRRLSNIQGANDDLSSGLFSKSHSNANDNSKIVNTDVTGLRGGELLCISNSNQHQSKAVVSEGQKFTYSRCSGLSNIQTCDTTSGNSNSVYTATVSSSNIKQLPPKKQKCFRTSSDPSGSTVNNGVKSTEMEIKWGSEKCSRCMQSLLGLKSSRCLQGHVTCGGCLEERVKLVLTGKSKESLRCVQTDCDSYYPMSELKHSLPSMVVEILEDKLDNDYIDYIASMIMKNACSTNPVSGSEDNPSSTANTVSSSTDTLAGGKDVVNSEEMHPESSSGVQKNPDDGPSNWTPMDKKAGYVLVPLKPESDEYVDVAFQFHNSMQFPTADIIKITRVQNHILWNYYSVKRLEMIHDNEGIDVEERLLFHGTNSWVVDAICKKGFDWRVCGKHGTVYGQGSYFAVNANYSHQYTDKSNSKRPRVLRIGNMALRTGVMAFSSSRPTNFPIPPPAHAGTNNNAIPLPGIPGMQSNTPQFGPQPIIVAPQGQNQGQSQSQTQTQGSTISNRSLICRTLMNHLSATGPPPSSSAMGFQFGPPAPPLSSVTVNSMFTTPQGKSSNSSSTFGAFAPRKSCFARQRIMGSSAVSSLNYPDEPQQDTTSVHKMFMSKVLVGKYTGGNASLRKPPPLFPDTDPYGKCYDSCVDNIMDPKIFVVFDSAQAYPEYLIEYNYSNKT